ncbi:spindle and centriole-associated protein 1 [Acomys russatus]|uniref:spindle and centriole-associated protein 1 n=1 Tax=Acomys russatus TaxID=60746 RepID=UPI0021E31E2F|nr:spindle and centriole-associated protein 1 [Acomys russatus]
MSLIRVNRFGPRGGGRKTLKVKKKAPVRQEWDNTVNDLTVHRATPEDLVRRHEIHKSKNRALVHWELQEKALKRKWKKQKPENSSLEKRKLSIMKEILSDQFQRQDVLENSDHLMAAAKGLFVDAPRKRTGFPNVTMAPDSCQSPIGVNQDPVTQSTLNESVIEPQALNEVDDEEEESTAHSQSEDSESELPPSPTSQPNRNTERFLHQLKEENSELISQLWTDIQQKIATQSQRTLPGTPSSELSAEDQKGALNATDAVKRIQAGLQAEESAETVASSHVGQVLNPRKQRQLLNKVKRKPDMRAPSKQRKNMSSTSTASADLPSSNSSSLDILKHMIHEVEHEMGEYERWTGREVKGPQGAQGLTGFTLSLVSSLCRLVRYLKESEIQLRKEVETRQQLEQMLGDHRELIDALTAEILLLREEHSTTQARLQQYMVTTDEQLISLTHAIKNCPVINNSRQESQASERAAMGRRLVDNVEGPIVSSDVSMPLMFRGEEVAEFPQEELPVKLSQGPTPTENLNLANNFPAHIFEPAVMLTPPRQKSNSEFSPLQDVLRRTVQTRPAPRIPPTVEVIEKEHSWEKKSLPVDPDRNSSEENRLFTQRWRVSHMGEDLENKVQPPFVSLSQPPCNPLPTTQQSRSPAFSEEPPVLGDGQQLRANEALVQRKDLMARIAELTLQNSAIKAHLNNITGSGGEQGDGLREPSKQGSASDMSASFPAVQSLAPSSMEERIAELNRQSMEARSKLLQLMEQQKLVGLNLSSSPASPVQPPLSAWAEEGKRTIDVTVPVVEAPESSKCNSVSPVSGISSRRSSGATSNSCSPLNATSGSGKFTPINPRTKTERQSEEGWFALSTHMP